MPTLIRLFVLLVILAGLAIGGMVALTIFVKPTPREMVERVPIADIIGEER